MKEWVAAAGMFAGFIGTAMKGFGDSALIGIVRMWMMSLKPGAGAQIPVLRGDEGQVFLIQWGQWVSGVGWALIALGFAAQFYVWSSTTRSRRRADALRAAAST